MPAYRDHTGRDEEDQRDRYLPVRIGTAGERGHALVAPEPGSRNRELLTDDTGTG